MTKDQKLLIKFLERNLPSMATTFDEGIGIASERFAMAKIIKRITKEYKIKSVLEAPVDGLMGIPGMNSVYFARQGAKVTVSSPSQKLLDNAQIFWKKLGLKKKVSFVPDPSFEFPFKDHSFDLVWNYCIFERFKDGSLLPIMKKLSSKYILITTQNCFNWGYPIHQYYHRKNNQTWDHGYPELMRLGYLKKTLKDAGLDIVETGFFDVAPWLDTFDMHTRGLGKKLVKGDDGWDWSSLQKGDLEKLSQAKLIKFLVVFEKLAFLPFNFLFSHHFYLLAKKVS